MEVETVTFSGDSAIPNSPLPVILYHGVVEAHDAATCEELFAWHGWLGAWRNGIYDFHHFHSTTHEVLGIVRGRASVMLGGPSGRRFELSAGDVAVLPAGTGHRNVGSSDDLLVVGRLPGRDELGPSPRGSRRARRGACEHLKGSPARAGPGAGS